MRQEGQGEPLNDAGKGWASAVPVSVFFALTPAAAVAGAMAFPPLLALAGVVAAPWAGLARGLRAAWPVLVCAALFVGFASVSTLWSPHQPTSLEGMQGLKVALGVIGVALFAAAAGSSGSARALTRSAGIAATFVLIAAMGVEAFGDLALNRMTQPDVLTGTLERNPGRGMGALLVLGLGAMGALVGGDRLEQTLWKVILVGMAVLSLQFNMWANAIALGLGAMGFMVAYQAPRFALAALGLGLAAWVVAAPFILAWLSGQQGLGDGLPLSWQVRLDIWSYVAPRVWEAPWIGHGLDASRAIAGLGQVGDLQFPQVPLHPHSAPLQIWYELGAVGAGLLAALLAAGGLSASQALARQPGAAGAACGGIVAVAVLWSVSYGAWQEWLIAVAGIVLALANAARR
jgi:exopolysaccharide production protein ExoQ